MTHKIKKKILILDNDPVIGPSFLDRINQMGHEGYLARSVVDANELMASHDFHTAILDAHAPNHTSGPVLVKLGFKYAFKLRQEKPDLRIITTHTFLLDPGYVEYLNSRKISYMQKPLTYEQLEKLLN